MRFVVCAAVILADLCSSTLIEFSLNMESHPNTACFHYRRAGQFKTRNKQLLELCFAVA